jgi:hypothetical protein
MCELPGQTPQFARATVKSDRCRGYVEQTETASLSLTPLRPPLKGVGGGSSCGGEGTRVREYEGTGPDAQPRSYSHTSWNEIVWWGDLVVPPIGVSIGDREEDVPQRGTHHHSYNTSIPGLLAVKL